jgi:transposase
MSARVTEIEDLREEVEVLRAALERETAARDEVIAGRDEVIAARDEALKALATKLRLTQEERDYYLRRLFGKKSEKIPAGPTLFDGAADPPVPAPDDEESTQSPRERKQAERRRSTGRKPLPASLPRVRVEHPLPEEDRLCSDCGEPRQCIGEDTSEELEFQPARWVVRVHARGRYVCPRHPDQGVLTPLAAPRPIPGSYAGPSLLAHVLVSKFDDHLPLYRQAEIFRRSGVDLARSTLCDWVGGATKMLEPVAEAIRRSVLAQTFVQADETPLTVQDGPEGRPKEAYLWAYRGGGSKEVFFDFRMGRGREGPSDVLKDFRGTLQTDAYPGYNEIVLRNRLVAAGCMAHARRKFYEALESSPREAGLVLVLIRRLYKIEERAQGLPLEEVARLRREESSPVMDDLKTTIEKLAAETTPATRLGKACSYALNQWTALCVFLDDPRVAIDNNAIERHIRSVAVGRNNWLFCGNEEGGRRSALAYTLVESCKAAGVEPFAYLTDVLTRLPGLPAERAAEFTPRAWAAARPR